MQVIKSDAMYPSQSLFHLNNQSKTDRLLRIKRRIRKTGINKKLKSERWDLVNFTKRNHVQGA